MTGLDIYIPTHNNLNYLQLCLQGIEENSTLQNRIIIHNDGCIDGTKEFLQNLNIKNLFVTESKWRGMYSAINQAFRTHSQNEYMMLLNDDTYPAKNWDIKLLEACKKDRVVCPICVEPKLGSFLAQNFGENLMDFKKELFLKYAKTVPQKIEEGTIGQWTLASELFEEMNGLDEGLDPFGSGGLDLLYRIKLKHPSFSFCRVYSSVIYHFSRVVCKKLENSGVQPSVEKFIRKWAPVTIQDANWLLEKKRQPFTFENVGFANNFLGQGLKDWRKKMVKVAVVLLTLNEEDRVEECLKQFRPYVDYILVVDGESTDRTVEIAKKIADKVVVKPFSGSFAEEKNYARTLVPSRDYPWIVWIDADERWDPSFVKRIKYLIEKTFKGGRIPKDAGDVHPYVGCMRFARVNLPDGKNYPDYQVRVFNNSKDIEWRGKIHEVPWLKTLNIPLDHGDVGADRGERILPVATVIDYPIIHLPRRKDIKREWWK